MVLMLTKAMVFIHLYISLQSYTDIIIHQIIHLLSTISTQSTQSA